jgi:alkylhydroperoxidase/carboxymuconolactone decarboxylase family protein YurZ
MPAPGPDVRTHADQHLDAAFDAMWSATARQAWAPSRLTAREQVFLTLVADVCQSCFGLPFEQHVRAGLDRGITSGELRALLSFVSYDTGYHAAAAGLAALARIETLDGLPRTDPAPPAEALLRFGPGAPPSPLPDGARATMRALDPHYAEFSALQSRMRSGHGPDTLDERERAFATMSVDVHYQTLGDSFRIHVARALQAGATPDDVREVLRFIAPFGATRAWQGWVALVPILDTAGSRVPPATG